jgi:hypothetical protein
MICLVIMGFWAVFSICINETRGGHMEQVCGKKFKENWGLCL